DRSWTIEPVFVQIAEPGSYNSAVRVGTSELSAAPPAARTFPFAKRAAAASQRALCIGPGEVQEAAAGSDSSALARKLPLPKPPAARTFPLGNKVAVAVCRGICMAPLSCQFPITGS